MLFEGGLENFPEENVALVNAGGWNCIVFIAMKPFHNSVRKIAWHFTTFRKGVRPLI